MKTKQIKKKDQEVLIDLCGEYGLGEVLRCLSCVADVVEEDLRWEMAREAIAGSDAL